MQQPNYQLPGILHRIHFRYSKIKTQIWQHTLVSPTHLLSPRNDKNNNGSEVKKPWNRRDIILSSSRVDSCVRVCLWSERHVLFRCFFLLFVIIIIRMGYCDVTGNRNVSKRSLVLSPAFVSPDSPQTAGIRFLMRESCAPVSIVKPGIMRN